MQHRKVDIMTICGGAVPEVFEKAFQEIIDNIDDPNTDEKKPRRIVMAFEFAPMNDRSKVNIKFGVVTKPVPVCHVESHMILTKQTGRLEAFTTDIKQEELFAPGELPEKKIVVLNK